MNQSNINLVDLPTEILLVILKKLDNMDVLYSLLGVDNQRLDTILRENNFTNNLNFMLTTLSSDTFSIADPVINQFCISILPRIHYNIKSLTLDSIFLEKILLAGDYPNLTQLKLFNINEKIVSHYFTDQSSFRYILQEQITDLILVFDKNYNKTSEEFDKIDLYGYIINFFVNLRDLSITGFIPYGFLHLNLHKFPSTICFSSTLQKLSVCVQSLSDCYALLDGRLKQLTTLNITLLTYRSSNMYYTNDLPNLKSFSLTTQSFCVNETYDKQILPLFRRMVNLEELTLSLNVGARTRFIDGTCIYNDILVYMPRLNKFNFCIVTGISVLHLTDRLSKEDIQRTFTNILFEQVECIITYSYFDVICHVFSLPLTCNYLNRIGNTFPAIIFNYVRRLQLQDSVPFEHEFFIRIAWSFPYLEQLSISNLKSQSSTSKKFYCDNQLYEIVKYPYLISLDLYCAHNDYVEQFLNSTKTHLSRLTKLTVQYNQLEFVTENFTRNSTRLNCINVNELNIFQIKVHSKDVYIYFPLL